MRWPWVALGLILPWVGCLDWDRLEPQGDTAGGGRGAGGSVDGGGGAGGSIDGGGGAGGSATAWDQAFPEAVGFGASALTGCRRDRIRVVTVDNLQDDGEGSLRWAIEDPPEPDEYRVVVFDTGGTIQLDRAITIDYPCLYVAGQTARGSGIQVRHRDGASPGAPRHHTLLYFTGDASDVVIRYLRLRSGKSPTDSGDNIWIGSGTRIVLDHLSLAYGNDDSASIVTDSPLTHTTVQRVLLAASLKGDGADGHGLTIGRPTADDRPSHLSIHHNLFVHSASNNPTVAQGTAVQVINNVVYNWIGDLGRTSTNNVELDLIGNYWKPGPWDAQASYFVYDHHQSLAPAFPLSVYFEGNHSDGGAVGWSDYTVPGGDPVPGTLERSQAIDGGEFPVVAQTATEAYDDVLADVGANRLLRCEGGFGEQAVDALDTAMLDHVRYGGGPAAGPSGVPSDYGGYPALAVGSACGDGDGDGMPDAYEDEYGLNATDAADALADPDGDGYVNLEEYLNGFPPTPR